MRQRLLFIVLLLALSSQAHADCVMISTPSWTAEERSVITTAAITLIPAIDHVIPQPRPATDYKICSATTDVTGLTSAALRTSAQTIYAAQVATQTAKDVEVAEIKAEVNSSPFCRNATYAQIASRIATEKAAVQADIDASTNIATAKTAMTTANNRMWAAFEKLARCTIGAQRLP